MRTLSPTKEVLVQMLIGGWRGHFLFSERGAQPMASHMIKMITYNVRDYSGPGARPSKMTGIFLNSCFNHFRWHLEACHLTIANT